ncbi:hypothetical protein EBR21_07685, partial [bacterium]|nr:hypothetical protein [bacterium]
VSTTARVGVGQGMLGRVIDGLGMPFDGGPAIEPDVYLPLRGERLNPLQRSAITRPMDVGVRSLNCLLTIGEGQRVGLIAGSGVGKSVLLGMMTRFTQADAVVIGAIGERGREVLDFVTETLGDEALCKAVVVASPGDCSPVLRVRAAQNSPLQSAKPAAVLVEQRLIQSGAHQCAKSGPEGHPEKSKTHESSGDFRHFLWLHTRTGLPDTKSMRILPAPARFEQKYVFAS